MRETTMQERTTPATTKNFVRRMESLLAGRLSIRHRPPERRLREEFQFLRPPLPQNCIF
jgi:hypothetical protein